MRQVNTAEDIISLCRALNSPLRLQILRLLGDEKLLNLNEISIALKVTNGAISQHMKILEDADLVEYIYTSGKRGSQKICTLKEHNFHLDILSNIDQSRLYQTEIPVGSFSQYQVFPTCGIATRTHVIGEVDESRYFDDPETNDSGILWFSKGFVEYRIPNYLKPGQQLSELQIAFEISSEAPGICEHWPSDVYFYINDIELGYWTSPGDFGGTVKGIYTPQWWDPNWNSYGLLKLLSITSEGTFIDGGKISDININCLKVDSDTPLPFRIAVPDTAENVGGVTLFGKGFGNYNQDIKVRVIFNESEKQD